MSLFYKLRYLVLAGTVVFFVLAWWLIASLINNPRALASPMDTVAAFSSLYANPTIRNLFLARMQTTLASVASGFAVAAIVGVPVGILMGRYVIADYLLDPLVNMWYSIPAIAFVPLIMTWGGINQFSTVIVAFLIAVFAVIINVYSGVKNISASLVEPATAFGMHGGQLYTKIILPATLPNLMLGLRLGLSRSIEGVIVAEMVFSVVGLGGMIFDSADNLELGLTVALILIVATISIVLNELLKYLNTRVVFWKESSAMIRQ